ncbi:succinate dehydrogenase protein, cytochrome b subunit [Candidatus Liberibacter solanacearum CLso-ZC1]|uniref:Succinate dehydrogenase cytochrome b556 subunit n=1 Tax=Liberibacter solanacearum (strain CLso-ZC1) TaxID=658172 RepID=E4UAZ0_LIBSC|nr:succinate dehydrogenase, cytochrome b556 subunit [Candidatus Liberibacter solanacearum]ADR52381.1 succinate dehydrogenase protein, cytochrome b subunit [Candidatus Liberibacter solanacearum CLso-ZC1]
MSDLKSNRPLSPHLQIYKLIPTMLISIVHRITGSAVYFGTPALVLWFFAVAEGKYTLGLWRSYTDCGFFSIFLFLYTWSAIHHMLGGIRYLMWDSSFLLEKKVSITMAKINIIASIFIVSVIWIVKNIY